MDELARGVWPWADADASLPAVLSEQLGSQYLSGFLIGCGVGGVVGASTLGVAMFSLIAPVGSLKTFTAVVPVVNCCANLGTISVYLQHADWSMCKRIWPFTGVGIALGTYVLPLIDEKDLRKMTSVVYALVLAQSVSAKVAETRRAKAAAAAAKKDDDVAATAAAVKAENEAYYSQVWIAAVVSVLCGVLTVITNNSGPIYNIYLLNCGLSMNQFVATRSVIMAGKNVAKVSARVLTGSIPKQVILHGCQIGACCLVGIQAAKPIKSRTSPEFYKYFTWCVLAYTSVKMWLLS